MSDFPIILAPVAALATNVISQVLVVRLQKGRHFLRSLATGFLIGALTLAGLEILFQNATGGAFSFWQSVAVNLPLYAGLSYCYFHFANLGQSSIRIRIYSEIAKESDGVGILHILTDYDENRLIQMRLQRLIESGDIKEKDGSYFIGRARLVLIAKLIFAAKRFILGRKSEFE